MVRGADVRPVKRAKASEHKPEEAGTSSPKSNIAQDLLDFINEAWTPFHAVGKSVPLLLRKQALVLPFQPDNLPQPGVWLVAYGFCEG